MNNKQFLKKLVFTPLSLLKTIIIALTIIGLFSLTGLIGSVTRFDGRGKVYTRFNDNPGNTLTPEEDFDFQFTIKDLDGNKLPFDQFKGKVIFLNLWATWCGPCRAEMEGIQKLFNKIDKKKISFVMLSLDRDADGPKVVDYIKKKAFTFPAFMPSGYLPDQLQVRAIPTTFIISKEGKVVKKEIGSMRYDTAEFQKFLEGLTR